MPFYTPVFIRLQNSYFVRKRVRFKQQFMTLMVLEIIITGFKFIIRIYLTSEDFICSRTDYVFSQSLVQVIIVKSSTIESLKMIEANLHNLERTQSVSLRNRSISSILIENVSLGYCA